jgi:hypothetical protein
LFDGEKRKTRAYFLLVIMHALTVKDLESTGTITFTGTCPILDHLLEHSVALSRKCTETYFQTRNIMQTPIGTTSTVVLAHAEISEPFGRTLSNGTEVAYYYDDISGMHDGQASAHNVPCVLVPYTVQAELVGAVYGSRLDCTLSVT